MTVAHNDSKASERHSITWGKAYLYGLGWLIGWCVPTGPMVLQILSRSEDDPLLYILIACSLLLLGCAVIAARFIHRSWRVALALLIQVGLFVGLGIGLVAIVLIGAASHPV